MSTESIVLGVLLLVILLALIFQPFWVGKENNKSIIEIIFSIVIVFCAIVAIILYLLM